MSRKFVNDCGLTADNLQDAHDQLGPEAITDHIRKHYAKTKEPPAVAEHIAAMLDAYHGRSDVSRAVLAGIPGRDPKLPPQVDPEFSQWLNGVGEEVRKKGR